MDKSAELYDLFGASPNTAHEELKPIELTETPTLVVVRERSLGQAAAALYELDFSIIEDIPPVIDEKTLTGHEEIVISAEDNSDNSKEEPVHYEEPEVVFPESVIARFDDALEFITVQSTRATFSAHDMERLTQHLGPMSHEERWYFKRYCKQHPALDYFGDGMFGLAERINPETYWPGLVSPNREFDIASLTASTVEIMTHARMFNQEFQGKHVMGIVKSQGIELSKDEYEEFMAQLAAYPGVVPQENGSFHVKFIPKEKSQEEVEKREPLRLGNKKFSVKRPNDITKAINKINGTDELKRAKELAKNYADARRLHGRHSKKRRKAKNAGRGHGKKQTFDQLLAEALKNSPKIEPIKQEQQDGSAES